VSIKYNKHILLCWC